MPEDVDVGIGDGEHHPLGHFRSLHPQLGVDRRDDNIEVFEQVIVQIEGTVLENVDFHPGQDAEWGKLLVERGDLADLLDETVAVEPMSNRQAGRMVGEHDVLVTERSGRAGHPVDWRAAITPARMHVTVALERAAIRRSTRRHHHLRLAIELGQICGVTAGEALVDQPGSCVANALQLGERAGGRPLLDLTGFQRADHIQGSHERLRLEP